MYGGEEDPTFNRSDRSIFLMVACVAHGDLTDLITLFLKVEEKKNRIREKMIYLQPSAVFIINMIICAHLVDKSGFLTFFFFFFFHVAKLTRGTWRFCVGSNAQANDQSANQLATISLARQIQIAST